MTAPVRVDPAAAVAGTPRGSAAAAGVPASGVAGSLPGEQTPGNPNNDRGGDTGVERFEDIGEALLLPFDIVREGSDRWYFALTFEGRTMDVAKSYRTPGLALDAIIEWARQRDLTIPLAGLALTVRRVNR